MKTIAQLKREMKRQHEIYVNHLDRARKTQEKMLAIYEEVNIRRFKNLRKGDRIKHETLGNGVILGFINRGELVRIEFARGGIKELLCSFSRKRIRKIKK